MTIINRKETVTLLQHFGLKLTDIFNFDPRQDFIRLTEEGLFSNNEMARLVHEDHLLLTAHEFERTQWDWSKGKIKNLSKKLDPSSAADMIGYWLAYSLVIVLADIYDSDKAEAKGEKYIEDLKDYLDAFGNLEINSLELVNNKLADIFTLRVLGILESDKELIRKKIYYVHYFAEQLLKFSENEDRNLRKLVKLLYEPPKNV
jgi:hypothetical protein